MWGGEGLSVPRHTTTVCPPPAASAFRLCVFHCISLPCGSTAVVPVSFPPPFCPLAAEAPPLPLPSIAARQVVLESIVLLTNSPRMTAAAAATTTANVLPMDPAQMKNLLVVGKK